LAFGVGITLDFILVAIARTRRIETIGLVSKAVGTSARLMGPLFAIAILLGFYIAQLRHEPLRNVAPRDLRTRPHRHRVQRRRPSATHATLLAAVRDANGAWTPELEEAAVNARPLGAWVLLILVAAVIALMVIKPA
jgi:hypothetical protein